MGAPEVRCQSRLTGHPVVPSEVRRLCLPRVASRVPLFGRREPLELEPFSTYLRGRGDVEGTEDDRVQGGDFDLNRRLGQWKVEIP